MSTSKIKLQYKNGTNPKTKASLVYAQIKSHKTKDYTDLEYEGSGLTEDTMNHAIGKLVKGIKSALLNGDNFEIAGLGTFKMKVTTKSAPTAAELSADDVKYNGLQFLVNKNLKKDLEESKFEFEYPVKSSTTESTSEDTESTQDSSKQEVE